VRIELVDAGRPNGIEAGLGQVLVDCVEDGASVGFLAPLDVEDAQQWWAGALRREATLTWVAREAADPGTREPEAGVLGVVQLVLATFPNAMHRAEVKKLLVHRRARGRGVASRLMRALEAEALRRDRWLLSLDTQTGSPAESIYERWGWQRLGVIDAYAANPDGRLAPTTFMTKRLTGAPSA
jgi:GNAT superfamily N-acetyltransferase